MEPPRLFSVVIPAWNVEDVVGEQLAALSAQTYAGNWEVLVADNGSTDRTVERVLAWSDRVPGLRVVDAGARRGRSAARNIGAADARGDFLLFLDADDRASPRWLEAMADAAARSDMLGGSIVKFYLETDGREILEDENPTRTTPGAVYKFLPYTRSCNFGIRADIFRRAGGFNESYDQAEDVELCWRMQLEGLPLDYVPDATVFYRVSRAAHARRRTAYRDGQGVPQLYHDFRTSGMPRSSTWQAARDVAGVLLFRPQRWFDPPRRAELIARLGWRAGNVVGSLRHRVVYL
jgi:glycosyltransferase involved in cell wall biosynthesis